MSLNASASVERVRSRIKCSGNNISIIKWVGEFWKLSNSGLLKSFYSTSVICSPSGWPASGDPGKHFELMPASAKQPYAPKHKLHESTSKWAVQKLGPRGPKRMRLSRWWDGDKVRSGSRQHKCQSAAAQIWRLLVRYSVEAIYLFIIILLFTTFAGLHVNF